LSAIVLSRKLTFSETKSRRKGDGSQKPVKRIVALGRQFAKLDLKEHTGEGWGKGKAPFSKPGISFNLK